LPLGLLLHETVHQLTYAGILLVGCLTESLSHAQQTKQERSQKPKVHTANIRVDDGSVHSVYL
jgi:hypothetical protein